MVRWLKFVVLVAGAIGLAGFFLPFFVFETGRTEMRVSGYHLLVGFGNPELDQIAGETSPNCIKEALPINVGGGIGYSCDPEGPHSHRSYVPYYFLSTAVMLLVGLIAAIRRRMGGLLGLFTLAASLLALGGWLRELRLDRINETSHTAIGGTLLGVSGVFCLLATVAVLIWREPHPIKKKRTIEPTLPEARIVR